MVVSLSHIETCPDCGSTKQIYDMKTGETICQNCGVILNVNNVASQPCYKLSLQVGPPTTKLLHDNVMTSISMSNKDAYGKKLCTPVQNQFYRLRKIQRRTFAQTGNESGIAKGLPDLILLAEQLNLPIQTREHAAHLFQKTMKKHLAANKSIKALGAACVYFACKSNNVTRSLKEVTAISGVARKEFNKTYNLLVETLGRPICTLPKPVAYILKAGSTLGISGEHQGEAIQLLQKTKKFVHSKEPQTLAAVALYFVCRIHKLKIPREQFSKTLDVNKATISHQNSVLLKQILPITGISDAKAVRYYFQCDAFIDETILEKLCSFLAAKEPQQ
ncbi:MAG: transcription initiation factor IIB [Candidatus Bathyarchaeia archaeon]|jgi:transcription initiation factor TFIIB